MCLNTRVKSKPVSICFVCLGNICRSPTAESVMKRLVEEANLADEIDVQSAGTSGWHIGAPPDERSRVAAKKHGFDVRGKSQKFEPSFFDRFDFIVAMDRRNYKDIASLARSEDDMAKVTLFRDHDPHSPPNADVPDPYYGGDDGFDTVLDICIAGCRGLLTKLQNGLTRGVTSVVD
ncbi:MAG: low molecular weight protein-tyrosine-phosphatase [Polyangiales bacterium]